MTDFITVCPVCGKRDIEFVIGPLIDGESGVCTIDCTICERRIHINVSIAYNEEIDTSRYDALFEKIDNANQDRHREG